MLRILLLIIIGGAIYWLWKWTMGRYDRAKHKIENQQSSKSTTNANMSELVQDPVCKLYIAKDTAISYKEHYFCSEKCKNDYIEKEAT